MSKSSKSVTVQNSEVLTSGDSIAISADILKLLAPVLKETTKAKVEGLKRNSKSVQNIFRRLLDGKPVVEEIGTDIVFLEKYEHDFPPEFYKIWKFDPTLQFLIHVEVVGEGLGVAVQAETSTSKDIIVVHVFEELMRPIKSDKFASINSMIEEKSERVYTLAQAQLITERCKLSFNMDNGPYRISFECGKYYVSAEIPEGIFQQLLIAK